MMKLYKNYIYRRNIICKFILEREEIHVCFNTHAFRVITDTFVLVSINFMETAEDEFTVDRLCVRVRAVDFVLAQSFASVGSFATCVDRPLASENTLTSRRGKRSSNTSRTDARRN